MTRRPARLRVERPQRAGGGGRACGRRGTCRRGAVKGGRVKNQPQTRQLVKREAVSSWLPSLETEEPPGQGGGRSAGGQRERAVRRSGSRWQLKEEQRNGIYLK